MSEGNDMIDDVAAPEPDDVGPWYYFSAANAVFLAGGLRSVYEAAGTWPSDAVPVTLEQFEHYSARVDGVPDGMTLGADDEGQPCWVPKPEDPLDEAAARKRQQIESARWAAEAAGITHNGVRYAGDPSNRQALNEALAAADDAGIEAFARWKDSDGQFHSDHPVADVLAALRAIATRRSQLIEREGELVGLIGAALNAEDRDALEAIEWSEE